LVALLRRDVTKWLATTGRGPSGLHVVLEKKPRLRLWQQSCAAAEKKASFPTELPALLTTHWHNVQWNELKIKQLGSFSDASRCGFAKLDKISETVTMKRCFARGRGGNGKQGLNAVVVPALTNLL
jgi:hypothetical protein